MRPGKIKNLSRLKIRNLFRGTASQIVLPDNRELRLETQKDLKPFADYTHQVPG